MRIDSNQNGPAVSESNHPAASTQAAGSGLKLSTSLSPSLSASNSSISSSDDQAQLSGAHVLVQALAAQASQLPEVRENVRQEKVSALRHAVQRGNYQPDPEQVADALFSYLATSRSSAAGETDWRASQQWAAAI